MKIHSIGIRFSDNDFGSTLRPLTYNIIQMIIFRDGVIEFTKEYIEDIFRKTIGSFYLMYQADNINDDIRNNKTIKYLEEHPIEIYLNEEVGDYLSEHDYWDNCEFFYSFDFPKYKPLVECV